MAHTDQRILDYEYYLEKMARAVQLRSMMIPLISAGRYDEANTVMSQYLNRTSNYLSNMSSALWAFGQLAPDWHLHRLKRVAPYYRVLTKCHHGDRRGEIISSLFSCIAPEGAILVAGLEHLVLDAKKMMQKSKLPLTNQT